MVVVVKSWSFIAWIYDDQLTTNPHAIWIASFQVDTIILMLSVGITFPLGLLTLCSCVLPSELWGCYSLGLCILLFFLSLNSIIVFVIKIWPSMFSLDIRNSFERNWKGITFFVLLVGFIFSSFAYVIASSNPYRTFLFNLFYLG